MTEQWRTEITAFEKSDGPLTKRLSLAPDGSVKSDGSACVMASGAAWRLRLAGIGELAAVIEKTRSDQAIALGALRAGLPDRVQIVTKQKLNGQPNTIARTAADINFRKEKPALALIDYDTKDMPPEIAEEIEQRGGPWSTLLSVLPPLRVVGHLLRRSTSAGLFRSDTGQKLPGTGGLHAYVTVTDGTDVDRALRALHDRCWIAGFGWMIVGTGGQLLERSIVDRMVGAAERLIFEGGPILVPPVAQDRESRRPIAVDGLALDTVGACPPLTIVETAKLRDLKAKAAHRLAPESAKVRAAFVVEQAERLAKRAGISVQAAAEQIARQCGGVLLPDIELPFDDAEFDRCTVGDVLDDPGRFEGATLADPLEGVDYGRCKARIMRRDDGTPWIHSFAHGRAIYELKHNAASVRAAMAAAKNSDVVETFVKLVMAADISAEKIEELRNEASERSGTNKSTISKVLKAAEREQAAKRRQQERERRLAERSDPRPVIRSPYENAPFLPEMEALNDTVGASSAVHPTVRDIDGGAAFTSKVAVPDMHAFTASGANAEEEDI